MAPEQASGVRPLTWPVDVYALGAVMLYAATGHHAPFYKADRETEMRAAHAHFQARLDAEIAAGRWS